MVKGSFVEILLTFKIIVLVVLYIVWDVLTYFYFTSILDVSSFTRTTVCSFDALMLRVEETIRNFD